MGKEGGNLQVEGGIRKKEGRRCKEVDGKGEVGGHALAVTIVLP